MSEFRYPQLIILRINLHTHSPQFFCPTVTSYPSSATPTHMTSEEDYVLMGALWALNGWESGMFHIRITITSK